MPSTGRASERKQFGNYELLAPLAAGGTAEIYLARVVGEAGFEKVVVVKQLLEHLAEDDEFVDMFLDEARLGSHLHHSNIVQTLELGKFAGRFFIVQEYVAGLTLAQTAVKAAQRVPGGLPLDLAVNIVEQSCAGLHHAHEFKLPDGTALKIVHRDVSPQNLVITFEGDVKLVDFGIAHAAVREARTKAGMIKGKFAYMSPEQCLGKPVDRRTDVFALGVVLWECSTGNRLFKRKTTYETYQAIVKGLVPAPSAVNPRVEAPLEAVILKALAYKPEDRFHTAEDMGEALENWRIRSGKRVSHMDIARFYERYFQPELEEHRVRMAAVFGNEPDVDAFANSGSWDAEGDVDTSAPGQTVVGADDKAERRGDELAGDLGPSPGEATLRTAAPIAEMAAKPTAPIVMKPPLAVVREQPSRMPVAVASGAVTPTPTPTPTPTHPRIDLSSSAVTRVRVRPPEEFPLPAPEPTAISARPQPPPVIESRATVPREPTPMLPAAVTPPPEAAPTPVTAEPVSSRLDSEPIAPPTVRRGGWLYVTLVLLLLAIIAGALLAMKDFL